MHFIYALVFSFLQIAIVVFTALYEIILMVYLFKFCNRSKIIPIIKMILGVLLIIAAINASSIWTIILLVLALDALVFIFF